MTIDVTESSGTALRHAVLLRRRREHARGVLMGLAIVILVAMAYGPVWRAGFIWDDDGLAVGNPAVQSSGGLRAIWTGLGQKAYHPITTSLWWLEYRLWGEWAMGWHEVNVALHAINAVLVWRVLRRIGVPGALGVGIIFGVHPVCVESVAWVSETKNTLSLMFALTAIRALVRREETGRAGWYWVALGVYAAALLSKSTVATLPAIWLVLLWWKNGSLRLDDWRRVAPMFAMSVVTGLVAVWFEWGGVLHGDAVREDGAAGRILGATWAIWFYAGKTLAPVELSMIYPRWDVRAATVWAWLPAAALGSVTYVLWVNRGRDWARSAIALGMCTVLGVLPVLGLVDISYFRYSLVADHLYYVGMIGVIVMVVAVAARMRVLRNPAAARSLLCVVTCVLGVMTWRQASVYANAQTLWGDVVRKNPQAWAAWVNLGNELTNAGRSEEAERMYRRALEVRPGEPVANYDLGMLLARQAAWGEALRHLERGKEVAARVAEGSYMMAHALREAGRGEESVAWYRRAIALQDDYAAARAELGMELARHGEVSEAARELTAALKLRGDWVEVMNNLAWIRATARDARLRDGEEAVRLARRACELTKYQDPALLDTLAASYAEAGRFADAAEVGTKAEELTPVGPEREAVRRRVDGYRAGQTFKDGE